MYMSKLASFQQGAKKYAWIVDTQGKKNAR